MTQYLRMSYRGIGRSSPQILGSTKHIGRSMRWYGNASALDKKYGVTPGNTRGFTSNSSEMRRLLKGHIEPTTEPLFGDISLMHARDSVQIGCKDRETTWFQLRRGTPRNMPGLPWGEEKSIIVLAKDEYKTITNNEHELYDTNLDIYLTLIDVGPSDAEIAKAAADAEAEKKKAEAERILADPNASDASKKLVQAEYEAARKKAEAEGSTAITESFIVPVAAVTVIGIASAVGAFFVWSHFKKNANQK